MIRTNSRRGRCRPPARMEKKSVTRAMLRPDPVGGGQHQRVVHVLPADLGLALRGDDEVAALLPIQHAAETTVGIKSGETTPVHGTGAGDQRCRVAVADQGVVGDGRVRMRGTSYFDEAPRWLPFQDSSEIPFTLSKRSETSFQLMTFQIASKNFTFSFRYCRYQACSHASSTNRGRPPCGV